MAAGLLMAAVLATFGARPAASSHAVEDLLFVTIAINAAGQDRLSIAGDLSDPTISTDYVALASDVAVALDRTPGSFRSERDFEGAAVVLDDKLAEPDERGGLSYALDSGSLQVLAQRAGFEAVIVELCTPRMRRVVAALVAPESVGWSAPGSRCGGWYQPVDEQPIRAEIQLRPDRQRFPRAVGRTVGAAAITFGILGIGATLLRRGPLRHRSLVSWLLASGSLLLVALIGFTATALILWWTGAANDSMLLGGGSVGSHLLRILLPGLAFGVPAFLPATILLSASKKPKIPPPAPRPPGPATPIWWPAERWTQWAAQGRR